MSLYSEAAAVLEKFEDKLGSVKSLVFASQYQNVRQLYALVVESLKHQSVLQSVWKKCSDLQSEEALSSQPHLATVLLYEHLLGKGLGRAGKIRSCILRHKRQVREACEALLQEQGVESLAALLPAQCQTMNDLPIPRYARVNLLKTTVDDVIKAFVDEGWVWRGQLHLHSFLAGVKSLGEDGFARDPLLPDVVIFPPGTDLHDHPLTMAAKIILQDRASCFPAHVLDPPYGTTVLDCCAAPGNKTSHTASLLGNSGRIVAYERDAKRMSLLRQQLKKSGVSNTRAMHTDFLSVDPHDPSLADVQYILVDPSCSGSGIISRMDHVANNKKSSFTSSSQRLQNLARFQISILKHALQFPAAQRVVYSTCSVHEEENEAVVSEVAAQVHGKFTVTKIFPEWPHRGVGESEVADCCLRMSPEKDLTNGFFVACFDRVQGNEEDGGLEHDEQRTSHAEQESLKRLQRKRKHKAETVDEDVSEHVEHLQDDDRNTQPDIASSEGTSEEKPQKKKKKRKKDKEKRTDANDIPDSSPLCFVNAGAELSPHDGDPVGTHSEETHCLPKKRKKKKIRREEKRDQESLENVACNEESALSVNSASQDNMLTSVQKSCVEDCEAKAKKKKKKKRKDTIL